MVLTIFQLYRCWLKIDSKIGARKNAQVFQVAFLASFDWISLQLEVSSGDTALSRFHYGTMSST